MPVLVERGRRIILLLVRERNRRLRYPEDLRDKATAIRAKARPGLLVSQDR